MQIIDKILFRPLINYKKEQFKETHINRALKGLNSKTYVEIGVRRGECFNQITAKLKIGIDPEPINFGDNLNPGEFFYKKTSDSFFSEDADQIFETYSIDVALVDGLHEFTQALRDVLNLEKYMSSNGVIFIHDCNPPTRKHAEIRDGSEWNGDVWKVALYLRTKRKDLSFITLNCDWGIGVLTNFHSSNYQVPDEVIIHRINDIDYSFFDSYRSAILHLMPPTFSRLYFYSPFCLQGLIKRFL